MKWLIFFMSPIDTKKRMLYYIGKNLRADMDFNYLARKIDGSFAEWRKNPSRLPILLNGARQVGKTESVRQQKPKTKG